MQIPSINSSTNFKGITPIRVYRNGEEILDRRIIENTSEKLINVFGGPLENKYKPIAAQLGAMDIDYCYPRAIGGYVNKFERGEFVKSDFIRVIYDKNNRGYLVTGPLCSDLKTLGHNIGIARKECKNRGLRTSENLEFIRAQYREYVKSIGNNLIYRTKEAFSRATGKKIGNYQEMMVNITTKPHKVKGRIAEKVEIENISFRDRKMQG